MKRIQQLEFRYKEAPKSRRSCPIVDFGKLGPIGLGKKMVNRLFTFVKFGEKGGEVQKITQGGLTQASLRTYVDSNRVALGPSLLRIS